MGTYGAATALTPAVDSMASRSIVLDNCFVDSLDVSEMLRGLWTGRHALQPPVLSAANIWSLLSGADVDGILITDCRQTALLAEEAGCDNACLIQVPISTQPAVQTSECTVALFFAEAASQIGSWLSTSEPAGRLIWIHSRGLKLPWDAPLTLRARFTDLDDPEPPSEVGPPSMEVTGATDPDLILGWGQVAAAQLSVIDESIELLHGWIAESLHTPTPSWCIIGLGGVPLGEHGWLGWGRTSLYQEELHVPAILLPSPHPPIGSRRLELCQLPDLGVTVAELCGLKLPDGVWGQSVLKSSGDSPPSRWDKKNQTAMLAQADGHWIRVPAWSLACDGSGQEALFVKPDDRWETSDVSTRCPEVVESLRKLGQQFLRACNESDRRSLPQLNDSLCSFLR